MCSAFEPQSSNFASCVRRTVSSNSSHYPRESPLAQFGLYVHKGDLKHHSFIQSYRSRTGQIISDAKLCICLQKSLHTTCSQLATDNFYFPETTHLMSSFISIPCTGLISRVNVDGSIFLLESTDLHEPSPRWTHCEVGQP